MSTNTSIINLLKMMNPLDKISNKLPQLPTENALQEAILVHVSDQINTINPNAGNRNLKASTYAHRTLLDTINSVANRRMMANSFFIAIHTLIIGILGYITMSNNFTWILNKGIEQSLIVFALYSFMVCLCFMWRIYLQRYSLFNTVFIITARVVETYLLVRPLSMAFSAMERFEIDYNLGRLEIKVPIAFMCFYSFLLLIWLYF